MISGVVPKETLAMLVGSKYSRKETYYDEFPTCS